MDICSSDDIWNVSVQSDEQLTAISAFLLTSSASSARESGRAEFLLAIFPTTTTAKAVVAPTTELRTQTIHCLNIHIREQTRQLDQLLNFIEFSLTESLFVHLFERRFALIAKK